LSILALALIDISGWLQFATPYVIGGNTSPVVCDDISAEGMPAPPSPGL